MGGGERKTNNNNNKKPHPYLPLQIKLIHKSIPDQIKLYQINCLNFFKQQYEGGFQTQTEAPLLQLLPINQQISHHG